MVGELALRSLPTTIVMGIGYACITQEDDLYAAKRTKTARNGPAEGDLRLWVKETADQVRGWLES